MQDPWVCLTRRRFVQVGCSGLLGMSHPGLLAGRSAASAATAPGVPAAPPRAEVDIGKRIELFVDDHLIERLGGSARLQVQRPEPKEIVLTADRPWEGNTSAYYTVFRDDDRYRMYYRGAHFDEKAKRETQREVTCYAESRDGIHWVKPDLGLFAFDASKSNNIVWDGPGTHNFTPFRDANPDCLAAARYKALAGIPGGLRAFRSADGVHWEPMAEAPVITRGAFDSQNLAFGDPHAGVYREFHRDSRDGIRDIRTGTSADFLKWTDPVFLEYTGAPREHLYTNAVLSYFRAPHLLVAFPTRFLPATEQTEPTFMSSRDGKSFRRFPDAVIPRTAPENRDGNRSNYMAWGLVQLSGHDRELSVYAKEAYYTGSGSRLRRFTYRLDGFVALHADPDGGEALTGPLRFQGRRLVVNARTAGAGSIQVGILGADGPPPSGYSASDSRPFRGDEVAGVMGWSGGDDLSPLAGQTIRLRFILKNADVFSFHFE
jgi:hypothetical protein